MDGHPIDQAREQRVAFRETLPKVSVLVANSDTIAAESMDIQTLGQGEWKLLDFLSWGRTFYHSRGRKEQSTIVQGTESVVPKEVTIEEPEAMDTGPRVLGITGAAEDAPKQEYPSDRAERGLSRASGDGRFLVMLKVM